MPRIFKTLSIAVHAVVMGFVFVAQLMSVGPLPVPRSVLAFEGPRIVIASVPPPEARRVSSSAPASITAAPVVAPDGVRKETGLEHQPSAPSRGDADGIETGAGPLGDLGLPGGGPPPPPPPPPQPPQRQPPVRLHSGMQPPRKTVHVDPVYPALAREARREGVVILEAIIDAGGSVESVHVLRGVPLLDQAAVAAVQQWRFTPALLNGRAVPVVMTVTVSFSLR